MIFAFLDFIYLLILIKLLFFLFIKDIYLFIYLFIHYFYMYIDRYSHSSTTKFINSFFIIIIVPTKSGIKAARKLEKELRN